MGYRNQIIFRNWEYYTIYAFIRIPKQITDSMF